jgi:chromosome segregation ATPase
LNSPARLAATDRKNELDKLVSGVQDLQKQATDQKNALDKLTVSVPDLQKQATDRKGELITLTSELDNVQKHADDAQRRLTTFVSLEGDGRSQLSAINKYLHEVSDSDTFALLVDAVALPPRVEDLERRVKKVEQSTAQRGNRRTGRAGG